MISSWVVCDSPTTKRDPRNSGLLSIPDWVHRAISGQLSIPDWVSRAISGQLSIPDSNARPLQVRCGNWEQRPLQAEQVQCTSYIL